MNLSTVEKPLIRIPGTVFHESSRGKISYALSPEQGNERLRVKNTFDFALPVLNPTKLAKAYDKSGGLHDGTIEGASWQQLPNGLWVLSFDGVDDGVEIAFNTQILDSSLREGTVSMWINPRAYVDSLNAASFYFGMEGGAQDLILQFGTTSGRWDFGCWSVGINSGTVLAELNKWQHVTGTYGAFGTKLYINGQEVATSATQPDSVAQSNNTYFGRKRTGVNFNGLIGEVKTFNVGFPASAVKQLYYNTKWKYLVK